MKVGDRIKLVGMIGSKRDYNGKEGVITSCKRGSVHVGVRLDNDFRDIAVMAYQVEKIK